MITKKMLSKILLLFFSFLISCSSNKTTMYKAINGETELVKSKNAILMIVDGQSVDISNLTRWYLGGPLTTDAYESGRVLTHNSATIIADSAPAATAMATGFKSDPGFIGVLPDKATLPYAEMNGEARRPIANILEAAKLDGKSIGIISTSEIMHATPAAFSSHYPNRSAYDELSEQQVYQDLDVIFGGGYIFFTPEGRKDGKDLVKEFERLGYSIIKNKNEMDSFNGDSGDKVWGAFASKDMAYDIDRQSEFTEQPSLAEMTKKAIEILSKNKNGFVLMVEGSKVDWAGHANDPIGMISDSIAYDNAFKVAVDFAKENQDTIVLSTADHGTGGIRVDGKSDGGYYDIPLESFLVPLKKAKRSGNRVAQMIYEGANKEEILSKFYGIDDVTPEELATLEGTYIEIDSNIGDIMSKRAGITYTTHGHTSEDVPLYSYLPGDKRLSAGVIDNTDYAKYAASSLGIDLDATSERLFMSISELQDKVDGVSAKDDGLILTLTKGDTVIEMPKNQNIAIVNGDENILENVVVYNGKNWYFPSQVVEMFK